MIFRLLGHPENGQNGAEQTEGSVPTMTCHVGRNVRSQVKILKLFSETLANVTLVTRFREKVNHFP